MIPIFSGGMGRLGAASTVGTKQAGARQAGIGRRFAFSWLTVLLVAVISLAPVYGMVDCAGKQQRQNALLMRTRTARVALLALLDAQTAVRGYVMVGRPAYLQPYYAAVATLQTESMPILHQLDALEAVAGDPTPVSRRLGLELALWDDVVATGAQNQVAAIHALEARHDKVVMDELRAAIGRFIDGNLAVWQRRNAALELEQRIMLITTALGGLVTVLALAIALYRSGKDTARRETAMREALLSREQAIAGREEVRQVFAMAETLQGASGLPDGAAILRASAIRLLPRIGGALYVFNNSRDRLDLVIAWHGGDDAVDAGAAPFLIPGECWAIKRSKPHLNSHEPDALRCCHAPIAGCSLEVPMVGRGEPVGLLVLHATQTDCAERLARATDIACVLADSMSLALSSILLRDKLRNQAVRDSLTGLYNRRFLEEVLQTLSLQAQRRQSALAAIMIDLDHFKQLNDGHGHAAGDMVLKGAAAAVLATLRASDVACRYGGEELVVLLPDCTLEAACAKAEQIRERIFRLSREGGPQVSASFGVSCMPATARDSEELLTTADAALYRAKQQGRNRVVAAVGSSASTPEWRGGVSLSPLDVGSLRLV